MAFRHFQAAKCFFPSCSLADSGFHRAGCFLLCSVFRMRCEGFSQPRSLSVTEAVGSRFLLFPSSFWEPPNRVPPCLLSFSAEPHFWAPHFKPWHPLSLFFHSSASEQSDVHFSEGILVSSKVKGNRLRSGGLLTVQPQ